MRSDQVICIKSTLDNPGTKSDQMLSAASITIPIPTVPALYAHDATLIPKWQRPPVAAAPWSGIPCFSVTGASDAHDSSRLFPPYLATWSLKKDEFSRSSWK
jgi:hypothetical protein